MTLDTFGLEMKKLAKKKRFTAGNFYICLSRAE